MHAPTFPLSGPIRSKHVTHKNTACLVWPQRSACDGSPILKPPKTHHCCVHAVCTASFVILWTLGRFLFEHFRPQTKKKKTMLRKHINRCLLNVSNAGEEEHLLHMCASRQSAVFVFLPFSWDAVCGCASKSKVLPRVCSVLFISTVCTRERTGLGEWDSFHCLVSHTLSFSRCVLSWPQIEISRRVTLEELPPVLVLHLKRFVFEKTGGCQKLVKNIDYPVDLEISKGAPV